MRKTFFYALLCAVCSACYAPLEDIDSPVNSGEVTKTFTFHVKGDFETKYEDMTRSAVRLENDNSAGITDVWVLDYDTQGNLVQQVHQTAQDDDFGHPSMQLTYGDHNIKLIASKGDDPDLTSSAISWSKVKDTFVLDYPISVSSTSNGNRAPELKRAVVGIAVQMADVVPSGATLIKVRLSNHYKTLTLPDMVVASPEPYENSFTISASSIGNSLILNTYSLSPEDTWTADILITAYAGNNIVSQVNVQNVEFVKNRITKLSGAIFDRNSDFSLGLCTEWLQPEEITF